MRILALKGGGVRCVAQLVMLRNLEQEIGPIRSAFDMIAGTSAGAVIGALLGLGRSPADLLDDMTGALRNVFQSRWIPWRSLFRTRPLRRFLDELFAEELKGGRRPRFGDLACELLIPMRNIAEGRTVILSSRETPDEDLLVWLRRAMTLPPFFEPDDGWVDGGIGEHNNPSLAAARMLEARRVPNAKIVCLDSGKDPHGFQKKANILNMLGYITTEIMNANDALVEHIVAVSYPKFRYHGSSFRYPRRIESLDLKEVPAVLREARLWASAEVGNIASFLNEK